MFLEYLFMMLITFICGLVVGLLHKGINITINHKQPEAPKEDMKAPVHMLPENMRQYAEKNNGQINF